MIWGQGSAKVVTVGKDRLVLTFDRCRLYTQREEVCSRVVVLATEAEVVLAQTVSP